MTEAYRPSKVGTNYDPTTGKLYEFRSGSITVMRAWPPQAWRKTRNRPFWFHARPRVYVRGGDIDKLVHRIAKPFDGNGQYLLPYGIPSDIAPIYRVDLAWLRWSGAIPREIRDLVCRFEKRNWHMLSLLARCGDAARDLTISNPALAYALASSWVYRQPAVKRPLRSARALLRGGKRQRDILEWLQFPATESARKTLARVIVQAVDVARLLYVRQGLVDPVSARAMSHLQRINSGAIRIATDPGLLSLAAPTLLMEVAHCRREDRKPAAAYLLRDTLQMHRLLFPNRPAPPPVRCMSRLKQFHDTLIEDVGALEFDSLEVPFPPPPLPGSDTVVPIKTARELQGEGRLQHNCVAGYIGQVARGRVYLYRVYAPERATLSLAWNGLRWIVSELRCACNNVPARETFSAVEQWYNHAVSGESSGQDTEMQ